MRAVQMVFQIILLLCSLYAISVKAAGLAINSSCQASCGNVSIPYPFGIGAGCYADNWFEVVCGNDSLGASPKPFLRSFSLEVLNISLRGTVRVNYPISFNCSDGNTSSIPSVDFAKSPFIFSQSDNRFTAIGCNTFASMVSLDGSNTLGGCLSICDATYKVVNASSCNGINCCQTTIPSDLVAFNTTIEVMKSKDTVIDGCQSAYLVEEKWFMTDFQTTLPLHLYVPVVLEWWIPYESFIALPIANNTSSTYNCSEVRRNQRNATFTCSCNVGFGGNPYVPEGCHGKVKSPPISLISSSFLFRLLVCEIVL